MALILLEFNENSNQIHPIPISGNAIFVMLNYILLLDCHRARFPVSLLSCASLYGREIFLPSSL